MPPNVKDHEFQMELDAAERLRHHSMEMQRNIEALAEARDHAREEAIASRRREEEVIEAARAARGRGEPSVIRLRHELMEMQQELAAAPSSPSVRQHVRLEIQDHVKGDCSPSAYLVDTGEARSVRLP